VLVAHDTQNSVWSVDAHLHTLGSTLSLHGDVTELIYDETADKVLALCSDTNDIAVIDPWTMTLVGYWSVSPSTKINDITQDDGLGLIFVGDSNGYVTVLDAHNGTNLSSLNTDYPISSLTYDQSAQQLFCLSQYQGEVTVVQVAKGGSTLSLGDVPTVTGMQSAAIIRGTSESNLWISFSDEHGSYIQCYSLKL
jgi:outer membrane protein assembly factor BamB